MSTKRGTNYQNALVNIMDELIGFEGISASKADELAEKLLEQYVEYTVLKASQRFCALLNIMGRKEHTRAVELVMTFCDSIPIDWIDFINALPNRRERKEKQNG